MDLSPSSGGVRKSSGYLYRQEKSSSFDWWGFQSDWNACETFWQKSMIFPAKCWYNYKNVFFVVQNQRFLDPGMVFYSKSLIELNVFDIFQNIFLRFVSQLFQFSIFFDNFLLTRKLYSCRCRKCPKTLSNSTWDKDMVYQISGSMKCT